MPSIEVSEPPRALIVTIYGLYGRTSGGWLPVSGLVRMLASIGVDEAAVRSAISRLKRRGLLAAQRRDGVAGYALSPGAQQILHEGDELIFAPPVPDIADGWLLAVFSVPETERAKRHTLRSTLAGLGFGSAAPGVWVAPAHRFGLTSAALERSGLSSYVDLFRGEYLAFGDIAQHARDWWDLDAIGADYRAFCDTFAPLAAPPVRIRHDRLRITDEPFAAWIRALTAWRRLPYRDPGLPAPLLPPDWPGDRARALLIELRTALAAPAAAEAVRLTGSRSDRAASVAGSGPG